MSILADADKTGASAMKGSTAVSLNRRVLRKLRAIAPTNDGSYHFSVVPAEGHGLLWTPNVSPQVTHLPWPVGTHRNRACLECHRLQRRRKRKAQELPAQLNISAMHVALVKRADDLLGCLAGSPGETELACIVKCHRG